MKFLRKLWFYLWEDDSPKGWIISLVFIIILIKFIIFPVLNFATGTEIPLAIVESCSMYHQHNLAYPFGEWWEEHENVFKEYTINELDFQDFPLYNGFNKGDVIFIIGTDAKKLEVGEVIVYNAGQNPPVIHRIIKIKEENGERIFTTMGDNVLRVQNFEEEITEDQILGKAVFKVAPYIGWVKLIFFEGSKPPYQRGLCAQK